MRQFLLLYVFSFCFFISQGTLAQVPPNDSCVNAVPIGCGESYVDSTDFATANDVEPVCQGPPGGCCIETGIGVWFSFTGTGDTMTLSTDNPGTVFDTELALYRGSCDTLTCIGGDDDGGSTYFSGLTSVIVFSTQTDTTYYVYVDGHSTNVGNYELSLSCKAPINDSCNAQIALPMNSFGSCPDSAVLGNNLAATGDINGCFDGERGVWYSFTTGPSQSIVSISLNIISGDHLISMLDACDGTLVDCDNPGDLIYKNLMPSNTYVICVFSFGGPGGSFELCVQEPGPPPVNDLCINAIQLECGSSHVDSTDWATDDDVQPICQGPPGSCCVEEGFGVWFSFTGSGDTMTLSTDNPGTDFDTELVLYRGSCDTLTCIGGDDDGGIIVKSILTFLSETDTTYFVYVDGNEYEGGHYELTLTCQAPLNDSCNAAIALPMNTFGNCPDSAVLGNNLAATADPYTVCLGETDGVWYSFTTGSTQTRASITMNIISGSHVIMVLDSCGGTLLRCTNLSDFVLQNLTPLNTYFISVFSVLGPGGSFELCVQEPGPVPSNDLCANAIQLECGGSHADSTIWATDDDVQPVCQGPPGSCCVEEGAGVWYSFTGTGDTMTLSTDNPGTDFDTELVLYRGSCDTLTCITGADDNGPGGTSKIEFASKADTTYYVYVDGHNLQTGNFELTLSCLAPTNDSCNAAIALPMHAFGNCPDSTFLGNNQAATTDDAHGNCSPGTSVWYSFVTGPAQTRVVVTLNIISGTNQALAIYDSCGGGVPLYCDIAGDFALYNLMPSTTYWVAIFSYSSQGGSFEICVSESGPVPVNDLCGDAMLLACGDSYIESTLWATDDDVQPVCIGPPGTGSVEEGIGVWFRFTGNGDSITLSTDNPGTNFDTELALYRGSCDTLTCIGGDDDGGTGLNSKIQFLSEADSTYYIYLDGNTTSRGNYELSISCDCPPFLVLNGSSMNKDDYETSGNLSSTQLILAGDTVDYDAAVDIDLLLEFEVQLGAVFNAFIDGCNNGGGGDNLTGDDSLDALSKPVQPEWIEAYLEKLTLVKKQNPGLYSEIEKLILQDGFTIQKLKEKGYDDLLKTFNLNDNKLFKR